MKERISSLRFLILFIWSFESCLSQSIGINFKLEDYSANNAQVDDDYGLNSHLLIMGFPCGPRCISVSSMVSFSLVSDALLSDKNKPLHCRAGIVDEFNSSFSGTYIGNSALSSTLSLYSSSSLEINEVQARFRKEFHDLPLTKEGYTFHVLLQCSIETSQNEQSASELLILSKISYTSRIFLPVCGNGVAELGEECDGEVESPIFSCSETCHKIFNRFEPSSSAVKPVLEKQLISHVNDSDVDCNSSFVSIENCTTTLKNMQEEILILEQRLKKQEQIEIELKSLLSQKRNSSSTTTLLSAFSYDFLGMFEADVEGHTNLSLNQSYFMEISFFGSLILVLLITIRSVIQFKAQTLWIALNKQIWEEKRLCDSRKNIFTHKSDTEESHEEKKDQETCARNMQISESKDNQEKNDSFDLEETENIRDLTLEIKKSRSDNASVIEARMIDDNESPADNGMDNVDIENNLAGSDTTHMSNCVYDNRVHPSTCTIGKSTSNNQDLNLDDNADINSCTDINRDRNLSDETNSNYLVDCDDKSMADAGHGFLPLDIADSNCNNSDTDLNNHLEEEIAKQVISTKFTDTKRKQSDALGCDTGVSRRRAVVDFHDKNLNSAVVHRMPSLPSSIAQFSLIPRSQSQSIPSTPASVLSSLSSNEPIKPRSVSLPLSMPHLAKKLQGICQLDIVSTPNESMSFKNVNEMQTFKEKEDLSTANVTKVIDQINAIEGDNDEKISTKMECEAVIDKERLDRKGEEIKAIGLNIVLVEGESMNVSSLQTDCGSKGSLSLGNIDNGVLPCVPIDNVCTDLQLTSRLEEEGRAINNSLPKDIVQSIGENQSQVSEQCMEASLPEDQGFKNITDSYQKNTSHMSRIGSKNINRLLEFHDEDDLGFDDEISSNAADYIMPFDLTDDDKTIDTLKEYGEFHYADNAVSITTFTESEAQKIKAEIENAPTAKKLRFPEKVCLWDDIRLGDLDSVKSYIADHSKDNFERPNIVNDLSPFLFAAYHGQCKIVEFLLTLGANLNDLDNHHQNSALHYAVNHDDEELSVLLLTKGIDTTLEDAFGYTALGLLHEVDPDRFDRLEKLCRHAHRRNSNV